MIKKHIYLSFCSDGEDLTYPGIRSYYFGHREYRAGATIGPTLIKYYTIHYVSSGEGSYIVNGNHYNIVNGDVFISKPGDIIQHKSSESNPWSLYWYEFLGDAVPSFLEHIGLTDCIVHQKNTILLDAFTECLAYCSNNSIRSQLILESLLLKALYGIEMSITPNFKIPTSQTIELAKIYIEVNYNKKITVSDIANHVGLDRSYFHRVFKLKAGVSPQEYLNNYRMSKSKELIKKGFAFKEISEILGINDVSYFSKLFIKKYGLTPTAYRNKVLFTQKNSSNSENKEKLTVNKEAKE